MIRRRTRRVSASHACALSGITLHRGMPAVAFVLAVPDQRGDDASYDAMGARPITGPIRLEVGSGVPGIHVPAFAGAALAEAGYGGQEAATLVFDLSRGITRTGIDSRGLASHARLWWASVPVYEMVRDSDAIAGASRTHLDGAYRLLQLSLDWKKLTGRIRRPVPAYALSPLGTQPATVPVTVTASEEETAKHRILAHVTAMAPEGTARGVKAIADAIIAEILSLRIPGPHMDRWREGMSVAAEIMRVDDVLGALGRGWRDRSERSAVAFEPMSESEAAFVSIVTPIISAQMGEPASTLLH